MYVFHPAFLIWADIFVIAHPPYRTWHKVNDPKVDYSKGLKEGKVWHEPWLEPCWIMLLLTPFEGGPAEVGALTASSQPLLDCARTRSRM